MTTTARLLGHLEWLRANLDATPDPEDAVYSAAIRLRAETIKDRTPDAILPKTARRQLREKVDALLDKSREASALAQSDKRLLVNRPKHFVLISKKLGSVTRLGVQAKLFNGKAVEWPEASQPMSLTELLAVASLPRRDKEATRIKSSAYQRRMSAAFKTLLSASLLEAKARSKAEKQLAAEALEVGAAMLSEASRGLPPTPNVRTGRKLDKAIATAFAQARRSSGRGTK